MAEEINYASVVFKNKTDSRREAKKEEEIVYDEVKVPQKKAEQAADAQEEEEILQDEVKVVQKKAEQEADTNAQKEEEILQDEVKVVQKKAEQAAETNGLLADQKATNKHRHYQLLACCLGIVCVILLFSIIAVRVNFTSVISENNNKLTAENQQLKSQIQNIENTVVQQNFDAHDTIKDGIKQRELCLKGWLHHQSSCYAIHNSDRVCQKTWEEAREDCRGKNSDLAVIVNEDEKIFISDNSRGSSGLTGYWIGLRVENWKWKWINGSDLTEKSWMTQPANNGYCAITVQNQGWKSVICRSKKRWICKKAALSV